MITIIKSLAFSNEFRLRIWFENMYVKLETFELKLRKSNEILIMCAHRTCTNTAYTRCTL